MAQNSPIKVFNLSEDTCTVLNKVLNVQVSDPSEPDKRKEDDNSNAAKYKLIPLYFKEPIKIEQL